MMVDKFIVESTDCQGARAVLRAHPNRTGMPASIQDGLDTNNKWTLWHIAGTNPNDLKELTAAGYGYICFMTAAELSAFQSAGSQSNGKIASS